MKKCKLIGLAILISFTSYAQFGVGIHQSTLSFAGFNYQFGERFIPELRFGTQEFFEELSAELVLNAVIAKNEEYQFYAGIGGRVMLIPGLVIPVGINIYPFENKRFGFQAELAALISDDTGSVLRGSWGIRYRFKSK